MTITPEPKPAGAHPWGEASTPYEELGGESAVRQLVNCFYDRMRDESPLLRSMHPSDDSTSRRNLYEFLSGWLGGPRLYTERKGNPQLRMRHLPFAIGGPEAAEWMRCMHLAIDDAEVPEPVRGYIETRLGQTAQHLRNTESG